MPTPAEQADAAYAAAADLATAPASVTRADGSSVTEVDPLKVLDVADRLAARAAVGGTSLAGRSRSPWNCLRPARAIPPGGTG